MLFPYADVIYLLNKVKIDKEKCDTHSSKTFIAIHVRLWFLKCMFEYSMARSLKNIPACVQVYVNFFSCWSFTLFRDGLEFIDDLIVRNRLLAWTNVKILK